MAHVADNQRIDAEEERPVGAPGADPDTGYVRQVRTAAERGGAVMVGVDPDDDFPALGGVAEDVPAEEDRPAQKGQSPRDERDEDDAARRAGGTGQGPTEIQPGTHEC